MEKKMSPMMQQYVETKAKYSDYILLYRLGDFYEMFFEDAIIASKELDIALTKRDCGMDEKAPMCGVPYHSVDSYIARLVSKGYKVTICEQIKDPSTDEVLRREIVRMITPGTVTEPAALDERKNNYIVGVFSENNKMCLCFVDISTGEILLSEEYKSEDSKIINELGKRNPKEIYANKAAADSKVIKDYSSKSGCVITLGKGCENCSDIIEKQMEKPLSELGLEGRNLLILTFGSLLSYLHQTQLCDLTHVKNLTLNMSGSYMEIDFSTWRNLEIVETLRYKEKKGSLLNVVDKTQTAMGARLLRRYFEKPLMSVLEITLRQDAVKSFYSKTIERAELRELLGKIKDVERLLTKVVYKTINPREMKSLSTSFEVLPKIKEILKTSNFPSAYLQSVTDKFDDLADLYQIIDSAVCENPPLSAKDGFIIKDGYSADVDEYRRLLSDAKSIIAELETSEKQKTGIKNLKVGYNKVFGYYIEVSNSNKDSVPDTYIRKQTLVNGERFITPELKEIEGKLLHANERVVQLEFDLFSQLRQQIYENIERIRSASNIISSLDVLSSLAETAVKNNYVCPVVDDKNIIDIKDGRHPVVECMLNNDMYVANDTFLNCSSCKMAIITGPNMAGKSTYMRGVALITLLAQIGSFVPAKSATIGIADKIFTRVGASDDLASGQSTFMIEMNEVAHILKNATKKSLLIFDEIGRGTSTFDGMSIARAVLEYVARKINARSLFATHYHELIALENTVEGVKNFNVAAKKRGNNVIFLRKIVEGGTDDSYGIDVARLAGVPNEVIKRAEEILTSLESANKIKMPEKVESSQKDREQLSLGAVAYESIIEDLKNIDPTVLTPIEAMNVLYGLSKKAKDL